MDSPRLNPLQRQGLPDDARGQREQQIHQHAAGVIERSGPRLIDT